MYNNASINHTFSRGSVGSSLREALWVPGYWIQEPFLVSDLPSPPLFKLLDLLILQDLPGWPPPRGVLSFPAGQHVQVNNEDAPHLHPAFVLSWVSILTPSPVSNRGHDPSSSEFLQQTFIHLWEYILGQWFSTRSEGGGLWRMLCYHLESVTDVCDIGQWVTLLILLRWQYS